MAVVLRRSAWAPLGDALECRGIRVPPVVVMVSETERFREEARAGSASENRMRAIR